MAEPRLCKSRLFNISCNYSGGFCWKECAAGYLVFPYVPQRSNLWILEDSSNLLIFSAYIVSRNRSWDETVSFMAWNCEFHGLKLWVSWLETVSFMAWNCEFHGLKLWVVLAPKKCTAPCLQGVSTEFVLIEGRFYKLACDVFAAIVP